jgi:hypothetical protein
MLTIILQDVHSHLHCDEMNVEMLGAGVWRLNRRALLWPIKQSWSCDRWLSLTANSNYRL